ncbi:MAG: hypothetical protein MPJ50_14635 [Pirellulales bacterium]|nr:hypothetical protein [Pirellulales bacterium]
MLHSQFLRLLTPGVRLRTSGLRNSLYVIAASLTVAVAWSSCHSSSRADGPSGDGPTNSLTPNTTEKANDDVTADAMIPLQRVVMFNSGVAYFDHAGKVEGNTQVELRFNVDDINDLLKSMVLQDNDGGSISNINFGSKDPITKTLKTFAIDLTENPTMGQLLGQIRGEAVTISAPDKISGTILGMELRKTAVGDEVMEKEFLNLLTNERLKSVALDSIGGIQLTDPELNAELRQALAVLATGHDVDKKTVSLRFTGEGTRRVNVGYIQEAPIWKTSYRLVVEDDRAAYLQGWAIVENTTENDWNDVNLTLVSGRPISFLMDLYQPLYVPRPVVEPELFASLRPQNYDQDLTRRKQEFARLAESLGRTNQLADELAGEDDEESLSIAGNRAGRGRAGRSRARADFADSAPAPAFDPAAGIDSVAQASDVGELFQYEIARPVTLPRRQSAMLPIVDGTVSMEKVSIYNPSVQAKHPLNGLWLTNGTDYHLMAGPVTVFDDDAYAGDSQIPNLAPGAKRLLSYALDLDTEVAAESKSHPQSMTTVRIVNGVMYTTYKYRRDVNYSVKNSGEREKKVLIEYTKNPNWTLTAPKEPEETTRGMYRFAVQASPGTPADLKVQEERVTTQQVSVSNANDDFVGFYLRSDVVSEELKQALKEIIDRKRAITRIEAQRQTKVQTISEISKEQTRIRQNMQQLAQNSELYRRYVQKFNEQETQIENLRSEITKLQKDITTQQQSLNDHISQLTVE